MPERDTAEKVRENRLRRVAYRQGLILRKIRRRDPRANDYGTYTLTNMYTNNLEVYSPWGGVSLDDIETVLDEDLGRHIKAALTEEDQP
jgi:hypothetical protein